MTNDELLEYQREKLSTFSLDQESLRISHKHVIQADMALLSIDPDMDNLKVLIRHYQEASTIADFVRIQMHCQQVVETHIIARPARLDAYLRLRALARWHIERFEKPSE